MKKIKSEEAIGFELLHDITEVRDGFKGARFKRGHIIQKEDVDVLLNLGKRHIFVKDGDENEVHEEDAALRLLEICKTEHTHSSSVSEGKIVLFSSKKGFLKINTELLSKINSIEPITITTLPNFYPVEENARIASMRIIPLTCKNEELQKAEELAKGQKLIELIPYQNLNVGIVITGSEVYTKRIKDKFEPVLRKKLSEFPAKIIGISFSDDDKEMIKSLAEAHLKNGADLLILTGGMSVDPDDITPTAIKELGGKIITHGVPAQPGNMTLISYKNDIPIIGVPGAAISAPRTFLDLLLPLIFAKEKITNTLLTEKGNGGLCQMCEICHFPNCTFGRW